MAPNYPKQENYFLDGIAGMDIIENIQHEIVDAMNGKAMKFDHGIVPIGNYLNFLNDDQVKPSNENNKQKINSNLCYLTTLASAVADRSKVKYALGPKGKYSDPFSDTFQESNVERNLETMFKTENLGFIDETSDLDSKMVKDFEESIEFSNGSYFVKLPWIKDKRDKIQSNANIALKVLENVVNKLEKSNKYEDYLSIFRAQEREGIIERIHVDPKNFGDFTWLPHRPIFKTDEQATTKIRPVFNASLKTKHGCSLNEAAYPGTNLLTDLLEILIKFRIDKNVLIGDIKQAFLQIKLRDEADKNMFFFSF